MAGYIPT
ncbi:hypothetical protein VTL71DRAFT_4592 [Oculimacula yallundae]